MLVAETGRTLPGRIGEFVVAPDQFEGRADLQLHLARRQPFAALVALGQIRPDALDRARQQALHFQRGGLDQRSIGIAGCTRIHHFSPFLDLDFDAGFLDLGLADLLASSSRSSCSSKSRRLLQKRS